MNLFKTELARYAEIIEKSLATTIPDTLPGYGDDPRKTTLHRFVLHGGKRLRPALAMMMADELGYPSCDNVKLFSSLEIFHNYLLVHDDIIDQDTKRWGTDTLHVTYQSFLPTCEIDDRRHFGQSQAIIAGDVLYSLAQDHVLTSELDPLRIVRLLQLFTATTQQVAWGWYKQFLSDYLPLDQVSFADIIQYNLIDVTSSYTFYFPLQFAHIVVQGTNDTSPALREFVDSLGILFQTGDDVIGLFGDPSITGKSDHRDILQGKKTIPMYYAYHHAPREDQEFLLTHLGKKHLTDHDIARIKDIVRQYGLGPTKDFLAEYMDRCTTLLSRLSYSSRRKNIFRDLLVYLAERRF